MALHVRALRDEERAQIERLVRARTAPVRLVRRARIIPLAAAGMGVPTIAQQLELSGNCVRRWRARFKQAGLDGVADAPRAGRPRPYLEDTYSRVIAQARRLPPTPAEGEMAPTCPWTLDRLQAERAKEGWAIKRSQLRR